MPGSPAQPMPRGPTRRGVVAGLFGSVAVLGASGAGALTFTAGGLPWAAGRADLPNPDVRLCVLTQAQRRLLTAIVDRLIPADNLGPGASEAGVVDFIDSQLAGWYGRGERWYMQGPFPEAADNMGYQQPYPPREFVQRGLDALDRAAAAAEGGQPFAGLPPDRQDALLTRLEKGELELEGSDGAALFAFVQEMTIEGFFSDPIYGGNRGMVGWRLVGFPGARYDYRDFVGHGGRKLTFEPVGLAGRPGWDAR